MRVYSVKNAGCGLVGRQSSQERLLKFTGPGLKKTSEVYASAMQRVGGWRSCGLEGSQSSRERLQKFIGPRLKKTSEVYASAMQRVGGVAGERVGVKIGRLT